MNIRSFFSRKKLLLINIFLSIYILINLIGGDRGLLSYFEKKKLLVNSKLLEQKLNKDLIDFEKKNSLLSCSKWTDPNVTIGNSIHKYGQK